MAFAKFRLTDAPYRPADRDHAPSGPPPPDWEPARTGTADLVLDLDERHRRWHQPDWDRASFRLPAAAGVWRRATEVAGSKFRQATPHGLELLTGPTGRPVGWLADFPELAAGTGGRAEFLPPRTAARSADWWDRLHEGDARPDSAVVGVRVLARAAKRVFVRQTSSAAAGAAAVTHDWAGLEVFDPVAGVSTKYRCDPVGPGEPLPAGWQAADAGPWNTVFVPAWAATDFFAGRCRLGGAGRHLAAGEVRVEFGDGPLAVDLAPFAFAPGAAPPPATWEGALELVPAERSRPYRRHA